MDIDACYKAVLDRLVPSLGAEARAAADIVFEDVAGYDRKYIFMNGSREMTDFMRHRISDVVDKVVAGEPVQYAVGKARFMGMDFTVDRSTLIPRPETQGLVDMITDDYSGQSDVCGLDVGTGSGCIAVSLARALRFACMSAMDISAGALAVAEGNARRLGVTVDFIKGDILTMAPPRIPCYDFIVSNPPYICDSEASDMDPRVLDYEPHGALFVPDADPMLFYRAIGRYGMSAIMPGGKLYFEINESYARETVRLLESIGYSNVVALRDYKGKYRFVKADRS